MKFKFFRLGWSFFFKKKKGGFPSFISKTDEERIQNLSKEFEEWKNTDNWYITEKLDGQSATFFSIAERKFFKKRKFGVCSRNLYLKTKHKCSYWDIAIQEDIENRLKQIPFEIAIQGEIIGIGIQKNKYNIKGYKFYVFNIKNLNNNKCLSNIDINLFCTKYGFEMVPTVQQSYKLPNTINELVEFSKCKSLLNNIYREGIVVRKDNISFKVINPEFLLKYDES